MVKYIERILIALTVVVLSCGCFAIDEPEVKEPDETATDDAAGNGGADWTEAKCECATQDISKRVFRISQLTVVEPRKLTDQIDGLWEWELGNFLLNVLFVVDGAEKRSDNDGGFSTLNFTVGPGWHFPAEDFKRLDMLDGKISGEEIKTYCLLDNDLNVKVATSSFLGSDCSFRSTEPKELFFHIGRKENPLMCAPLLEPKNSTPLHNLSLFFRLNDDCSQMVDGYLEGCMPLSSVDRICMCGTTGMCDRTGAEEDAEFPAEQTEGGYANGVLKDYCQRACGSVTSVAEGWDYTWNSYRAMMGAREPDCKAGDGIPGYLLSARFTAKNVTEKFSSDMSDCQSK